MNVEERRNKIIELLKNANEPISGNEFAQQLHVTRQIVVSDIALLKANNRNIISTNKGYLLVHDSKIKKPKRTFCIFHEDKNIKKEFEIILKHHGSICDVIVEHEIYGPITVDLIIHSEEDALKFLDKMSQSDAKPLSYLTSGIHYHTIEAFTEFELDQIQQDLANHGFLIQ